MFSRRAPALVVIAALACWQGACRKRRDPGKGPLALFPADTQFVLGVDLRRLSRAAVVTKWMEVAGGANEELARFTRETGLDPRQQLESITMAMPSADGDIVGIVIRAQRLDEARIVAYLPKLNGKQARALVSKQRGRHTFWSSVDQPRSAIVFFDQGSLIAGTVGWTEMMVDLADGGGARSAASNSELARLVSGASSHTVWAAGLVSDKARAALAELAPAKPALAKVRTFTVAVDVDSDMVVAATAQLATPAEAQELATQAEHIGIFEGVAGGDDFKLWSDGSVVHAEKRVGATQLGLLAALPFAAALAGGNEPPMRRYAEKLVATSRAKLTVSRCEMFGGSRKGFCIVDGTAAEITSLPVRLHMVKRPAPDVRFGQTCAAQEAFGHPDGAGHAFNLGVREFAAQGPLPTNTDNVKFVSLFAGQTSACIEFEYPYG